MCACFRLATPPRTCAIFSFSKEPRQLSPTGTIRMCAFSARGKTMRLSGIVLATVATLALTVGAGQAASQKGPLPRQEHRHMQARLGWLSIEKPRQRKCFPLLRLQEILASDRPHHLNRCGPFSWPGSHRHGPREGDLMSPPGPYRT
jgi:hypothetical protein